MQANKENLSLPVNEKSAPLLKAFHKSEQIKDKVQACATELSLLSTVLKQEAKSYLPFEIVMNALQQSEQVEQAVKECAHELHAMNAALALEIKERMRLEHMLSATRAKLFMTQAELFDTQMEDEKIRHLAFHDALTGLPNRRLFNDRLEQAMLQATRDNSPFAVFFIDLDCFKQLNDQYGHSAGDRILQTVALRLCDSVRSDDTVSRHGGDEFICLLPAIHNTTDIANFARKLIKAISQPIVLDGIAVSVKPSIGISLYGSRSHTAAELIKNADAAMYRAKQQKKGYCFFFQLAEGSRKA